LAVGDQFRTSIRREGWWVAVGTGAKESDPNGGRNEEECIMSTRATIG
jgi:hypothetical protein